MTARLTAALALLCLGLALGGGASATPPLSPGPPASAQGLAVEIIAPDESVPASTTRGVAPPTATLPPSGPFAYPADGSVVSADSTFVSASASAVDGTAAAVTEVSKLSLFDGDITADEVRASVSSAGTIGDLSDSTITNLVVLGQPVAATPNLKVPLGDWGSLTLLASTIKDGGPSAPSWHGTITALVVHLDSEHGGLDAGETIRVGFSDAYARPPETVTTTTTTRASPPTSTAGTVAGPRVRPTTGRAKGTQSGRPEKKSKFPVLPVIPDVTPKLTAGGYVFPVDGPSGYGDTFGAPRGDVQGGWHHGDDIFAPLGSPVLAVADGTVFSVGWNDVGGYRIWLRDRGGNEFYYAHLSAYTTLAVNGRHVKAGDVLGFVGNTGDAEGTPFHLHFEVHPVAMLFLGYDGAVNPTKYLDAWKHLEDIRILPAVPFAGPDARISNAPPPGAILLESSDISTANGLDPGSLTRVMNAPATIDLTTPGLGGLPLPLPVLDRA